MLQEKFIENNPHSRRTTIDRSSWLRCGTEEKVIKVFNLSERIKTSKEAQAEAERKDATVENTVDS